MPDHTNDLKPLESFHLPGAFAAREKELSARLDIGGALTEHGTLVGTGTEHGWYGLLGEFLPGRYGVVTGKVVDSRGHQSQQIDLIVHDTFYSPLMFTVGGATFVPAESVYAVFEVKQTLDKVHLGAAADKAESVRRLHRTSTLIPNQFGKEVTKDLRTFPILAGILGSGSGWKIPFNDILHKHLSALTSHRAIDIGCALGNGAFDTERAPPPDRALLDLTTSVPGRTLSFFAMRLLYRLQQLGTVGAIDYEAYAEPIVSD